MAVHGVTNLRFVYWDVERDTLIAIPLFIFMGIMLQKSKIAEDLLVTMESFWTSSRRAWNFSCLCRALLAQYRHSWCYGRSDGLISLPVMCAIIILHLLLRNHCRLGYIRANNPHLLF